MYFTYMYFNYIIGFLKLLELTSKLYTGCYDEMIYINNVFLPLSVCRDHMNTHDAK